MLKLVKNSLLWSRKCIYLCLEDRLFRDLVIGKRYSVHDRYNLEWSVIWRVGPLSLGLWLQAKIWPTLTSQPRTWPGSMRHREEGACHIFKVSTSFTCLFILTMQLVVSSLFCRRMQLTFGKSHVVAVGCFQTVPHLPRFSTPVSYQYPFYKSFLGYRSSMEFDSDRC